MREFYIATCSNCVFLAPYESSKRLHRYCKLHERLRIGTCCIIRVIDGRDGHGYGSV